MMNFNDVLKRYIEENLPEFVCLTLSEVNQVGNFGNTPLHVACTRGIVEEVEALIKADANVNAIGEHDSTPLHDAAEQGHILVVKLLLSHGASVNLKNEFGRTPLDIAIVQLNQSEGLVAVLKANRNLRTGGAD